MPTGKVYDRLAKITARLSKKYNSPRIRPHVTLIGGFTGDIENLLSKAEALSKRTRPFSIRLSELDSLDEFFRCVFMRAEKTPELAKAHETARKLFSLSKDDYLPHLSLIYGDFDEETKKNIIRSIGKLDIEFEARSIHFVFNNERNRSWPELEKFGLC